MVVGVPSVRVHNRLLVASLALVIGALSCDSRANRASALAARAVDAARATGEMRPEWERGLKATATERAPGSCQTWLIAEWDYRRVELHGGDATGPSWSWELDWRRTEPEYGSEAYRSGPRLSADRLELAHLFSVLATDSSMSDRLGFVPPKFGIGTARTLRAAAIDAGTSAPMWLEWHVGTIAGDEAQWRVMCGESIWNLITATQSREDDAVKRSVEVGVERVLDCWERGSLPTDAYVLRRALLHWSMRNPTYTFGLRLAKIASQVPFGGGTVSRSDVLAAAASCMLSHAPRGEDLVPLLVAWEWRDDSLRERGRELLSRLRNAGTAANWEALVQASRTKPDLAAAMDAALRK